MEINSNKTSKLASLREAKGLTQKQVADFFELKDRNTIGAWERGEFPPAKSHRSRFISYLWDKLHIRDAELITIWSEVMEGEWGWKALSKTDFEAYPEFRTMLRIINEEEAIQDAIDTLFRAVEKPGSGLLEPQKFSQVSFFRRRIAGQLDEATLAYALRCSLQHGKDVPFWSKRNKGNLLAIDTIYQCIVEQPEQRRPLLRAGYALQQLNENLKSQAIDKLQRPLQIMADLMEIPSQIVEKARNEEILKFIREELSHHETYKGIVNQVLLELAKEPD